MKQLFAGFVYRGAALTQEAEIAICLVSLRCGYRALRIPSLADIESFGLVERYLAAAISAFIEKEYYDESCAFSAGYRLGFAA